MRSTQDETLATLAEEIALYRSMATPSPGSLIRLEDGVVHKVIGISIEPVPRGLDTPWFKLSGCVQPTTLAPSKGGSRWEPAERGAVPATLLEGADLMVRVLNLKRRPERLEAITAVLGPHAELRWAPMAAFDGEDLDWTSIVTQGHVTRSAAEEGARGCATVCTSTGCFSPHLTLGAVGCALSHRAAWQELVASDRAWALVLEDDVDAVSHDLVDCLVELLRRGKLPSTCKLCYLGSHEHSRAVRSGYGRLIVREMDVWEQSTGLFGYLVSRRGAAQLLGPRLFPLSEQLDVAVSELQWSPGERYCVAFDAPLVTSPRSESGATDV